LAISVEVWGEYACFSRPEFKVERMSYDIITPSAARGILESIFWHPGMRWRIDKINVMAPIQFTNIRRNEVSAKISARNVQAAAKSGAPLYLATTEHIQQRATTALKNVRYIIHAHFDMTDKAAPSDNHGKFQDIIKRRLAKGQCYSMPYLGTREFAAFFAPAKGVPPCHDLLRGERDLGYMLYDMDYSNPADIRPMFFRAILKDGVLDLSGVEVRG